MDKDIAEKLEKLENMKEGFHLRLKVKVLDQLRGESVKTGKSVTSLITEAVEGYLSGGY